MTYYSALHYAAKAKKSEEKAAEYLQQVGNKVTAVEGSIGDIGFAPLGIDESQNKRRYLNGQVISQAQFKSFTNKIKAAIQLYPSLSASETNWQAEVTNSALGQCGKFVIDDTLGIIRLPKVVNINGLQDLALMGSIKAESLPNHKHQINSRFESGSGSGGRTTILSGSSSASPSGVFDANSVYAGDVVDSSTYQDNAPVQQEAIQYPYFIQVATGTEETVDVSREIELNNPFSLLDYKWSEYELNNASWLLSNGQFNSGATYVSVYELLLKIHNGTETKDGVSVKLSTEAYTDTDFVINTTDTTFRLPIKVKLASGNAVVGNGMTLGLTDGTNLSGLSTTSGKILSGYSDTYDKTVGTAVATSINILSDTSCGITTDPDKSGIETSSNGLKLYFYVGETIQDANVINASQVLTKVANGVDKTSTSDIATVIDWNSPSLEYVELVPPTVARSFIDDIPFDGILYISKYSSFISIERLTTREDNTNNIISVAVGNNVDGLSHVVCEVSKGDNVMVNFNTSGSYFKCHLIKYKGNA